ncbi:MAG: Holliday junction branch migration protein RuvA [Acidobacteriota bacterium]|jgi:holliday junction DNA helicase RuvA
MIAQLKGILAHKSADRLIIDVHGVGYEVTIPFSTYYELGAEGQEVVLKTYTHVREDTLSLFGFRTLKEKRVFLQLIQISGIGPRLAVTILSGLPIDDLLAAVAARDIHRLSSIPGVGKKTAERIALELADKVKDLLPGEAPEQQALAVDALGLDVVSALVNLGYQRSKAEASVSRAKRAEAGGGFEVLLKRALKELSG